MDDVTERFLARLAAQCVPSPELPAVAQVTANPNTKQLIRKTLALALAMLMGQKPAELSPSILPVLRGTGALLGLWLRPWVALLLLASAAMVGSLVPLILALPLLYGCCTDWQLRRSLWHPGPVPPGLHFADTPLNQRRATILRAGASVRRERELTRWLWNGDLHTLLPFLAFESSIPAYRRFWIASTEPRAPHDKGELVALDVALPAGGFDRTRPVALICHGLNGGSGEAYVTDFVAHVSAQGWTAVVMVARGLGGTHTRTPRLFHGARTDDLASAAQVLSRAVDGAPLVGVGFSMGGIVLANYCGVAGASNPLACAVSLSGCYDCVANRHFAYSNDYWQPWLTQQLKTNFALRQPHRTHLAAAGIDIAHVLSERVRNVAEFDAATVVPYNGFGTVEAYYAAMSLAHGGKLARVAVPLMALHAVDDPIVDSATFASAIERTTRAADAEYNPNCWFRITRSGGHVGWSLGNAPARERWAFMHIAVTDFAAAVLQTQQA